MTGTRYRSGMAWDPPAQPSSADAQSGWKPLPPQPATHGPLIATLVGVGFVAVVAVGALMSQRDDDREPARLSLREQLDTVCPSFSACGIQADTTGPPYTFTLLPGATDEGISALGVWARETECLESVDFSRIEQTRALDGMVESANGRSTWTYHPDDGLTIVCA